MISAAPQSGNEALLAGANDYIEKPFHVHYLLNIISKYTRVINRQS
jgi:DNA-binding response OmpR family regulator